MFKYSIRMAVAISLIAVMLVGCGSKASNKSSDASASQSASSQESNSAPVSADKKEMVTLKFFHWYNDDQDKWNDVYKAFQEKYPYIKVESVTAGDNNSQEYLKKLDLAAASGDQIDLMMFSAPQYYAQRAAINMLEPLDDYIAKDGYKVADDYYSDPAINGKTYGLPAKKVSFFVLLNKNHLDEAGLTVPKEWTWDEYLEYAKKLTKGEGTNKRYGTYFHSWSNYTQLAQGFQMDDYYLLKPDGKTLNVETPLMKKSLEIRHQAEFVDKSATPFSEIVSQKLNYRPQYFSEKASMIVTGDFLIPETGGTDKVPANFKTAFAPLPTVNKGDPQTTTNASDLLSVYSKSKHKEEAYLFARWYTTEGIQLQGKYIPSYKKADIAKVIDNQLASAKTPEMVDKESLLYVMQNQIPQNFVVPVSYYDQADQAFLKEMDLFLLGKEDVDTALKNAAAKIQEVVNSNSK
ncbi:extracellular solute-binding protein [Cohnella endophytica]|uniref:Extracellular solute-binding protein n=1 Tax=Cohnella endophytica TaxID=2419778 RepID=A0A494YDR3_9BACL|nr:extracellular solute-binding protein [Cohnella endophytica]RKP58165.1 extracellular solute-binding protein [Cohnella endophytica]